MLCVSISVPAKEQTGRNEYPPWSPAASLSALGAQWRQLAIGISQGQHSASAISSSPVGNGSPKWTALDHQIKGSCYAPSSQTRLQTGVVENKMSSARRLLSQGPCYHQMRSRDSPVAPTLQPNYSDALTSSAGYAGSVVKCLILIVYTARKW